MRVATPARPLQEDTSIETRQALRGQDAFKYTHKLSPFTASRILRARDRWEIAVALTTAPPSSRHVRRGSAVINS